jgi:xanthine dehydrogenase YagR molybdenum-binding subunit
MSDNIQISTTINGKATNLVGNPDLSALEAIREQVGLTGTKLVCGSGACGACTILVDGESRCSCIMPAVHLEGKKVTTVEGHANGQLHPVQKAFLAHDALQCGYCTPGFINAGVAFYTSWQSQHGKSRPTREQIADGLAGNLCRCGAYAGIYEAIAQACMGSYDDGQAYPYSRVDAPEKVSGKAKYTTDIVLEGQVHGFILRSPHPHAKVVRLDLAKALENKEVKAGISLLNAEKVVRYEGQPIAAIAITDKSRSRELLALIEVEYEVLPFLQDYNLARKNDAPRVYPNTEVEIPVASEGPALPGKWEGNKRKGSFSLSSSNAGQSRKMVESTAAPYRYTGYFQTATQYHTAFEPHCAIAHWTSDTSIDIFASTQAVHFIAEEIAKRYKLEPENVHLRADYVGGAFGAKLGMTREIIVALELSKQCKLPVAVTYSRAEELQDSGYRPATQIEVDIATDAEGKKAAFTMDAYSYSGIAIGANSAEIAGLVYPSMDKALADYDVVTNFAIASAFRGPGGPSGLFALEQGIDQLAYQQNVDPLEFRKGWEKEEAHQSLFKWVDESPLWQRRPANNSQNGQVVRGVGLAFGAWMHLYQASVEVEVTASPEGFSVSNAVQDMGQGAKSVLAAALIEVFKVLASEVKVIAGSSKLSMGPPSGGSRTTASIFPAAQEAAEKVLEDLKKTVLKSKGIQIDEVVEGGVKAGGSFMAWDQVLENMSPISHKVARGRNAGFNPMGMVPLPQGLVFGQGRSYGAYVIEVLVDKKLGKVKVTDVHGVMRAGKIHVRSTALSQCYGGVIQGIGHALYESGATCPKTGRVLTRGLEDYRLPGLGDIPPISIDFLEEGFDFVKGKGIGMAEMCTIPIAAAIGNAVFNATGWRPDSAPILPQNVINACKTK